MRRIGLTVILIIVVLAAIIGVGYTVANRGGILPNSVVKDSGSNISDYSAVFLTNGQVYFGKIVSTAGNTVDIKDIYYLQVNQQIQPNQQSSASPSASAQPQVTLVKLGDELHGPNDLMHINRDQILFTESMKSDSKVVKAISDSKNK